MIIAHHLVAIIGLPFYFIYAPPSLGLLLTSIGLVFLTGFGISGGYHRFYSHGAYHLKRASEAVFLFLATMAVHGPVLKWAHDHRLHHANIDKPGDPYNVTKGFWHAHVLWIFENPPEINERIVQDLKKNRLVMFQFRHYGPLAIFSNVSVSVLLGFLFHDFLGAFVLGWGARALFSYHLTWFINSIAHYWGEKSYSKELSARDNLLLAFLTLGEGYHNYHHTFPSDYRNGVRKFHFDPIKWTIWGLSKVGLADSLRSFRDEHIVQRLVTLDKALLLKTVSVIEQHPETFRQLLARRAIETKLALESQIHGLADSLAAKRNELRDLLQEKRALRNEKTNPGAYQALKEKLKVKQELYAREWKEWADLCSAILRTKLPGKLSPIHIS